MPTNWIEVFIRSRFEETTNLSTQKHMMLTQENTQLGALIQTITEIEKVNITEEIFNTLPKVSAFTISAKYFVYNNQTKKQFY